MLFLGRKKKVRGRTAYRLVDMHQLSCKKECRGVMPLYSYPKLSLEDQLDLAEIYNLCPRVFPWGDRKRICGQGIRDSRRNFCGTCSNRKMFRVHEGPTHVPKLLITPTTEVHIEAENFRESGKALLKRKTERIAELEESMKELETTVEEQKVKLEQTLTEHMELLEEYEEIKTYQSVEALVGRIWNSKDNSSQTFRNSRACMRDICKACGLSFNDPVNVLIEHVKGDIDSFGNVLARLPDARNKLLKLSKIARYASEYKLCEDLQAAAKIWFPQKSAAVCQLLSDDNRACIIAAADHLGVSLDRARPGERLLSALQHLTTKFEATDSESRRWKIDQLFMWYLPAIRGGTSRFKICSRIPEPASFKVCDQNYVVWDGKTVTGLFFGNLKLTQKKYAHLWHKRFALTPAGITTCGTEADDVVVTNRDVVPIHMQDYWAEWCAMVFKLFTQELAGRKPRKNAFVFQKLSKNERNRQVRLIETFAGEQLGVEFHSQLGRKIFRNGVPSRAVNGFFMKYVMQHDAQVDRKNYVKPELRDGPF